MVISSVPDFCRLSRAVEPPPELCDWWIGPERARHVDVIPADDAKLGPLVRGRIVVEALGTI
jgi:hypothetical protein